MNTTPEIPDDIAAMTPSEVVEALRGITDANRFAASLVEQAATRVLTERQIEGGRIALTYARIGTPTRSHAGIDLAPIRDMFEAARGAGYKAPKYRAERLVLSRASDRGKNPGAIYVKTDGGAYQGKVIGAEFRPGPLIQDYVVPALRKIAENPREAAVEHGRRTGRCACCGRTLTDPNSVAAGIGPQCAKKWGLE